MTIRCKPALVALNVTIAGSLWANTIRTDIGDGTDAYLNGGNKSTQSAGGAGVMLSKEVQQPAFKRLGIFRFDLRSVKDDGTPPRLLLFPQEAPQAPDKLNLYGIRDRSEADTSPDEGGWIEGETKNGVASDSMEITWERREAMLGTKLMPFSIASPDVELLMTVEVAGGGEIVFEGVPLTEFIKKDQNGVVSFILGAESDAVSIKTKEWRKFQVPTLKIGASNAESAEAQSDTQPPKASEKEPKSAKATPLASFDFLPTDPSQLGDCEKSLVAEFPKFPRARFFAGTSQDAAMKGLLSVGKASAELVPVESAKFPTTMRIVTEKDLPKPYSFCIKFNNEKPIAKGDSSLTVYNYRTLNSTEESGRGGGRFWFVAVGRKGTYSALQDFGSSSNERCRGLLAATANGDYAPHEAEFDSHPGGKDGKTMEFGGISVTNFRKDGAEFKITLK